MRQLYFEGPNNLAWHDVPEPRVQADHEVLVATVAATTCDVDAAVIMGFSPFEPPFAIGHEAVARVVDMGDAVEGFAVGDVVSVPYHRSCGFCPSCLRRTPLHCENKDTPAIPSYGFPHAGEWGGMFSEKFRVPFASHSLVKMPDTVDPLAAVSAGDNLSDSYSTTVPHLAERPGARVLITSFGGYGLYATLWSLATGARMVTYVDHDHDRLSLAASLGAEPLEWSADCRVHGQYDLIVNARPGADVLRFALRAAAPDAVCENVVIFFEDTPLPLAEMHFWGVHFHSSYCPTRLYMPDVIQALAAGAINPRVIESDWISLDDVPSRLAYPSHRPIVVFENQD